MPSVRYILVGLAVAAVGLAAVLLFDGSSSRQAGAQAAAVPPHPLDPLSTQEIRTAFRVIEASQQFPAGAFFPIVTLKEPPKSEVNAWVPGDSFRREAFANVYDRATNRLFEAVVNLRTEQLISFTRKQGAQPAVFASEFVDADTAVRADPRWRQAMRDRGIAPKDVYIDVWAPGDILVPNHPAGGRVLRAIAFYQGDLPNPYDRPIEGVVATVDMNSLAVIDVIDSGIRPVNKTITGNAGSTRPGLKPLNVVQPNGPSFDLEGNSLAWQRWRMRIGYSPREGLILHQIGYMDNGVLRPIIHRMSLDEIWVPYALPDGNWAWRTAMDVGEYNLGQYMETLAPKQDVPTNAAFLDEVAPSDLGSGGGPQVIKLDDSVAIYERDAGSLWDRSDPSTLEKDPRFARELVVTATSVIGNYTYTTEYVFRMDGGIDIHVGSTGTTLNRGVNTTAEGEQSGTNVAPKIAAPQHQHYFNFRIDFDVDGTRNRLVEENTRTSPTNPFGNAWQTDETLLGTERFRDTNPASDRHWAVESTTRSNALGEPTGYALEPINLIHPYVRPDFEPLHHAPFAEHNLWVTQFNRDELYAGGDYPNQAPAGEGLTKYSTGAPVDDRDLVVWYTVGHTHKVAVEQYPVMTRETVGFSLRPDGFFNENPALDAP